MGKSVAGLAHLQRPQAPRLAWRQPRGACAGPRLCRAAASAAPPACRCPTCWCVMRGPGGHTHRSAAVLSSVGIMRTEEPAVSGASGGTVPMRGRRRGGTARRRGGSRDCRPPAFARDHDVAACCRILDTAPRGLWRPQLAGKRGPRPSGCIPPLPGTASVTLSHCAQSPPIAAPASTAPAPAPPPLRLPSQPSCSNHSQP